MWTASRSSGSRCSGRGCRRAPRGSSRRSAAGCARAGRPRRRPCPACRSRTARRPRRGTRPAPHASVRRRRATRPCARPRRPPARRARGTRRRARRRARRSRIRTRPARTRSSSPRAELVAQEREQARAGPDVDLVLDAVHGRADLHAAGLRSPSVHSSARRASTSTTWRRYAAVPRTSSIGFAPRRRAVRTRQLRSPAAPGRARPTRSRRPRTPPRRARARRSARPSRVRAAPCARTSSWRQTPAIAITIALRVPTLANEPGPSATCHSTPTTSSSGARVVRFGPSEERVPGFAPRRPAPSRHDVAVVGGEHGKRVAGRRGRADVAADRGAAPDLRRADRARRLHQRPELRQVAGDSRECHRRRRRRRSRSRGARLQLVDTARGRAAQAAEPPEVDADHQVRAAGDRHGVGVRRPRRERLVERAREQSRPSRPRTAAKASIIAATSSPSGYSTGHVQPESTYSCTFARHSSAVPEAVISCTTSSGTSSSPLDLLRRRGPGEHRADLLQQLLARRRSPS